MRQRQRDFECKRDVKIVDNKGRVVWKGPKLVDGDFSNLNLRSADFSNKDLSCALFYNCDLTGANFSGATLNSTTFIGSILDAANFSYTRGIYTNFAAVPHFSHATFVGSNFIGANFLGCEFNNTNLKNCCLFSCNLDHTTFRGDLSGADLESSSMTGADFSQAIMINVKGYNP